MLPPGLEADYAHVRQSPLFEGVPNEDLMTAMGQGGIAVRHLERTISELRHLAERPVRIRLSFESETVPLAPEIFGNTAQWEWIGKGVLEIQCPAADKASLVRKLGQSRLPFRDIEIIVPSLDEIYAHFLRREVRQEAAQ